MFSAFQTFSRCDNQILLIKSYSTEYNYLVANYERKQVQICQIIYIFICQLMRSIVSRNPYTGQIREQLAFVTDELIHRHIDKAKEGFELHRKRGAQEKCGIIKTLLPMIEKQREQIAKLITYETGKPIVEAQFEINSALRECEYYSKHFQFIVAQNVKTDARKKTLIKYFPTGTVLQVLPFAFPFWINFKMALPQLLLGNSVLVRNSDSTPGVGRMVQKLMWAVGFESGEYQSILSSADQDQLIVSKDEVVGVNFMGSSSEGAKIAALAGKYIKKTSLQLSSSDAMVVLDDANVHLAVQNAIKIGLFNSGQGPTPKRFIVRAEVYNLFKDLLIQRMKSIKFGNPQMKETEVGPLARPDLHDRLSKQLQQLAKGCEIVFQRQEMRSPFFPLTLLENTSPFLEEEVIGPVFQICKVETDEQAIKMANSSRFQMATSIFSAERGKSLMDQFSSGQVYLNGVTSLTPALPYGGVGLSGYGRLGWSEGVRQFANIKTTYIS